MRLPALLTALVAALAVIAAPARAQYRGVVVHSLWARDDRDIDRDIDLAKRAGSNVVRTDIAWSSLQQDGRGTFNAWYVGRLDRLVNRAAARGMKVIATLQSTPCWASRAPDSVRRGCAGGWWERDRSIVTYPPADVADYAAVARWVTARYGTKLAGLEVWNEPNLGGGFSWRTPNQVGDYAALLRAAYPAAKAGDPRVSVLGGEIFLMHDHNRFLKGLYAAGIKGYYDALAVHTYVDAPSFGSLRAFHAAQRRAGDRKPLWLTEFGWNTGTNPKWRVSESRHATKIVQAFKNLARLRYLAGATLYELRDDTTDPRDFRGNTGVVRQNFSLKPGFYGLQAALKPKARRRKR